MPPNPYIFASAEESRDKIFKRQTKEIKKFYLDCARDIDKLAKRYANLSGDSARLQQRYYEQLREQILAQAEEISKGVERTIVENTNAVAESVANCNVDWLSAYGINGNFVAPGFSTVCNEAILSVLTGAIYADGMGLSSRIWRDLEMTKHDINTILAQGIAEQKPIYDIAKDLEEYVDPGRRKPWNLRMSDGRYIYKNNVDYCAQRLARTTVQHSYQKSLVDSTIKNPFVLSFRWVANGSRPCELCLDRDGIEFPKDALPLDHPNGMCIFEPVTPPDNEIIGRLAEWVVGDRGDDAAIDAFAESLGFRYD